MNLKKTITISIICLIFVGIFTGIIAVVKPKMHKTIMLEQIIFKRSTTK